MRRQAIFIALGLLFAVTTSCFGFVHALLGGCDDIEKDFKFEKTLREKCNKELEEANQRAADADDVKRQLGDCQNDVKKLKNDIEKLKKEKDYAKGEATDYENMLIREQTECRKKDKRCKAGEEQLQQTQNKLTECEDKLIDCGGTQSVQAKKHVEFLKGQINDLKKLRDRLESELEDTQTSFRNLRYTETICQSNYSDLVQQLSEYKSRIQSLQNENQACQKGGGAGGIPQFYFDTTHIAVIVGVAGLIFFILWSQFNSLKEKLQNAEKQATELRQELEKRPTGSSEMLSPEVVLTQFREIIRSESRNVDKQSPITKKKPGEEGSTEYSQALGSLSADEDDVEDDDHAGDQGNNAASADTGNNPGRRLRRTHPVQNDRRTGEDEISVNGETEPAKDEAKLQGELHGSHRQEQSKTVPKEGSGADQTITSEKTAAERGEEGLVKGTNQENQVRSEGIGDGNTESQPIVDVPGQIDRPTTTTAAAGGANPQDELSLTSEKTKKRSIKKRLFGNKNGKGKNK